MASASARLPALEGTMRYALESVKKVKTTTHTFIARRGVRRFSAMICASVLLAGSFGLVANAIVLPQPARDAALASLASVRSLASSSALSGVRRILTRAAAAEFAQVSRGMIASVKTDKQDYLPGDTAQISGKGFLAGETVVLQVRHTDGTGEGGGGHDPWPVQADGDGGVTSTWYVNPDDSLGSEFLLTADGQTSGLHAEATFADAPNNPAADLDQCRNGDASTPNNCVELGGGTGWVNGNVGAQQGHLVEGYSIPYRMRFTNLTTGTWTVDLGFDIIHGGKNAIDFLTHYARLNEPFTHQQVFGHQPECVDPTDGFIGLANGCTPSGNPDTTFTIPKPNLPNSLAGNPPGTPPCQQV